ncbi:RHS repeat domain-containing protein [Dyadobacter sp. OTU695]|uniref:RHS repeat domain-containing protein n=1 Tax=Dyadobacter sp. OTU695 TaxID=3043860 RepID=UPI00313DE5A3
MTVDANTEHHEERNNGAVQGYTLDKTAPKTATEANLLTITFYDDYAFSKPANLNYSASYYPSSNANVKGQTTGTRARLLPGSGAVGGWLTSVTYYDAEYRPIQAIRELSDLGANSRERISTQYKYDLAPVAAEQKTEQLLPNNVTHTYIASFEYDHADRLLSVKEKVMSANKTKELFTTAHRYNTLGQEQSHWLHSPDNVHYLRKTNLTYNIRSWQTEGRTVYKQQDNNPEQNFFGYNLSYANGNSYTNGNISQMQWLNQNDASYTKGLNFTYDHASRMTGSAGVGGYADTEGGVIYDKNGNLKAIVRAGAAVDNLTYTYSGNRLSLVNDGSGSNLGVKSGASSYGYDGNGNMTSDGNRSATLTYNYLNLPKTIALGGKTATYDYDALGGKHKYVFDTLTLKYAGQFQYRQVGNANNPYRIALSEGQAIFRNNNIAFEYYLKDHLGNVRLVFDEKGQTLQRTDYYPFGLEIDRNNPAQQLKVRNGYNRYLYNNKELQVGIGYLDCGARIYMSEIGRAAQIDPMSHHYYPWSAYGWVMNNPLKFTDPTGMLSTHTDENGNVVAVYDDGDLGVYKHQGNGDGAAKAVQSRYSEGNTDADGQRMGQSLHALSFADQNLYNRTGQVAKADIKIDFGSKTLTERVQAIINSDPSIGEYFNRAGTNGDWDLKTHVSNGSLLYGRYASPRDAGNFAAGAVAELSFIEPIIQFGYGAYNLTNNNKPLTGLLSASVGALTLWSPGVGIGVGYLIGKYGESKLTQRSIDIGKNFIRKQK